MTLLTAESAALPSLLAPLLVSGEVVMECIIPFVTANLVNQIKAGCSIGVIVQYGAVLVVMAGLSLTFGALAGSGGNALVADRCACFGPQKDTKLALACTAEVADRRCVKLGG